MKNLMIYLIHYTPLHERKKMQVRQLNNLSLDNNIFIEQYDKEKLQNEDIVKFQSKKLRLAAISLFRKQIYAMDLIQKSNFDYNLILEDDAILDNNFVEKLTLAFNELPDNYDMLFLGNGCNLHIPKKKIKPGKLVYKKCRNPTRWGGNGGSRCSDSIIISKKCAKKICNYYENTKENSIDLSIDWWYNKVIRDLKLNIYWIEPTIVRQGSHIGIFNTSI